MSKKNIGILGTGAYLPKAVLSNFDLEKLVETSDQWIRERSGVQERRIAGKDEDSFTMGLIAARQALANAGVKPEQLSYIIMGTNSPAYFYPAGAIRIQEALGANGDTGAFDVQAGCCGFTYALHLAQHLVAPEGKYALVVGSDTCSRFIDYTDRGTCILFGDGAGAVVVGPAKRGRFLASFINSNLNENLYCRTEFTWQNSPFLAKQKESERNFVHMEGREVFKFAVNAVRDGISRVLEMAGVTKEELDYLVIHQGNYRILEAGAKFAGVPMEKVFVNIHKYGNTSAGSVPIALHEALGEGRIKEGDKVILIAFGAGATWSGALLEWGR